MEAYFNSLAHNTLMLMMAAGIALDTILGVLRACKERRFNSSAGIDGAIRKVSMLVCALALAFVDKLVHIDLLALLPDGIADFLGIEKIGLCEFFCLLFFLCEAVSVLKNLTLCGVPVPAKLRGWVESFLDAMTDELSHS